MKEKTVVAALKRWLDWLPGAPRTRKLADRFTRGYPDLQTITTWAGALVLIEIEAKAPRGKMSALQLVEANECRLATAGLAGARGYYVRVGGCRSVDELKDALRRHGLTALVEATDERRRGKNAGPVARGMRAGGDVSAAGGDV